MITIYLKKNGMQGSYGHGEEIEEALDNARSEFKYTWGGKPSLWSMVSAAGKATGHFSNYKQIIKSCYKAMGVPAPRE